MSICFLGLIKKMRSYYRQYFYVFFGVVKQNEKVTHWSTVPCLSSFIKMKDQKKRRGFTHVFISCSCPLSHFRAWHPFHVYVKWVGSPLPPSHDYSIKFILRWLVTLPVIHGVWCLFRRVNVAESYYLISQLAWKSSALKLTHYQVLRTSPPVSVQLWSLHHLPLFHVDWWRIHQGLPSTDFFLSTSAHHPGTKSRNLSLLWYLGNHFHHWWFSSRLLVVFTIDHYSVDFPHVRPQLHLFTWDEMY